jgi:hypothetical protein
MVATLSRRLRFHEDGIGPAVTTCVLLCAVLAGFLMISSEANAKTHSFHVLKFRSGLATFKVRGLSAASIRSAHLSGPRRRRFSLRQIRSATRRGSLRVRVSESDAPAWSPRRVRLLRLIVTTKGRQAANKGREARRKERPRKGTTDPTGTDGSPPTTEPTPTTPPGPTGPTDPSGGSGMCSTSHYSDTSAFGVGNWPSACWRPYADTSPFNRPLPSYPRLVSNSSAIVTRLLSDLLFASGPQNNSVGDAGTTNDWSPPIYYAKSTDPLFTVHCTESWGRCESEAHRIRIPDGAKPAGGGDGHLGVIQPDGDEYDFWQVSRKDVGGGALVASWGGITRIDGDGLGSNASAAHKGLAGGRVRAQELEAGRIDHALLMTVKCVNGSYVYPAESASATPCTQLGRSNANAPALGAHFYLDYTSDEIQALPVAPWKKAIVHAIARYGMFISDTGSGSWAYGAFEGGMTYESFGVEDRMVTYSREHGLPTYKGLYIFDMGAGVDWSRLRVVDPCVAHGTC